ncbi:hypothetical protein G9A89_008996 [Geosiphon pyriformis]|nr:hypothetical protein G9A89_008996 [Geosiphon pyriformis]
MTARNTCLLQLAISKCLPVYDIATNLSANSISTVNLSATATNNLSTTATSHLSTAASSNLSIPTSLNAAPKFSYDDVRKPEIQNHPKLEISNGCSLTDPQFIRPTIRISSNYLSLLVIPEDVTSNNPELDQQPTILTNNISLAIITNNELLTAIFLFKLKEVMSVPLFSRAALEEKSITAMYTDAKVNGHSIKLILNSAASTRIITADSTMKTPIGKINDFPIEVNDIITPIKVLVIEATQYQALVDNDWLSKNNAVLDWTTQELQLSQNGQHTRVLTMCGHFKPNNITTSVLLINLEEKKLKPTWKAYQVL